MVHLSFCFEFPLICFDPIWYDIIRWYYVFFSFCFANRLVLPFRFIFNLGVPICYVISLVSYATIHLNSQYNIFAKYFLCIFFFCINFFIVVNNLLIFCMVFHFFGFSNIYIKNKADIYIYIYIYIRVLFLFYVSFIIIFSYTFWFSFAWKINLFFTILAKDLYSIWKRRSYLVSRKC